jgi:hypothetical protein
MLGTASLSTFSGPTTARAAASANVAAFGDERARRALLECRLGMSVQVVPPLAHLRHERGDLRNDVHGGEAFERSEMVAHGAIDRGPA